MSSGRPGLVDLRVLLGILPVAVFFILTGRAAPWIAILASFATSAAVFSVTRRSRVIGTLTAFGFLIVAVSAIVGALWGSEKAYLASGPVADFLFPPLYVWSIAVRRPIVGGVARELVPWVAARVPPDAPVFVRLSLVWAAYDLLHGVMLSLMLEGLTVREYIIWSRVAGWPATAALVAASILLIARAARGDDAGNRMRSQQPEISTEGILDETLAPSES